jgi:hypothetical protein
MLASWVLMSWPLWISVFLSSSILSVTKERKEKKNKFYETNKQTNQTKQNEEKLNLFQLGIDFSVFAVVNGVLKAPSLGVKFGEAVELIFFAFKLSKSLINLVKMLFNFLALLLY